MEVESRIGKIENKAKVIYSFLSDFNNFKELVPSDKVQNWTSDKDFCHFSIAGMGETGLRIIERTPFKLIKVSTETGSSMNFLMWIQLKEIGENDTRVKITNRTELNPLLSSIAKAPLKTFADSLIDKMESFVYPEPK